MEGFLVDLNTFLGLAMPNQSCLGVTLGDILGLEIPNLNNPYI